MTTTTQTNTPDAQDPRAEIIARYAPLLAVAERLQESSNYWSEYDVPVGIVEALKAAIEAVKWEA